MVNVDSILKEMWSLYKRYRWRLWTVLSIEMYVKSVQAVIIVDSIVSRNVCGDCTSSIGGCCG